MTTIPLFIEVQGQLFNLSEFDNIMQNDENELEFNRDGSNQYTVSYDSAVQLARDYAKIKSLLAGQGLMLGSVS